jgi:hypothetical protein
MITFTLVIALIATASALPTHHRLAPHSLFPNKANRTLLSTEQLLAAFDADGYQVVKSHTLPNGHRGFLVRSKTASIWASDGMYKTMRYVEGDAFDMGFLSGYLTENATAQMVTTYVKHLTVQFLIGDAWDQHMSSLNGTQGAAYQAVLSFMYELLTTGSVEDFQRQMPSGIFPADLVTEMKGMAAGCYAANPNTVVTTDKIIGFNYCMDFLTTHLYAGELIPSLTRWAQRPASEHTPEARALLAAAGGYQGLKPVLAQPWQRLFRVPMLCEAFVVSGNATKSGRPFIGRSFELPDGLVYQFLNDQSVFVPTDGRNAFTAAGSPGMIGGITILNEAGLGLAMDLLRTFAVNVSAPGVNTVLLLRNISDYATTRDEALRMLIDAPRGTSFLYTIGDACGDGSVAETAMYTNSSLLLRSQEATPTNALAAVRTLKAPHDTPHYEHGVYVRNMDYVYPEDVLAVNAQLFASANLSALYNASSFVDPVGMVFANWTIEHDALQSIGSNYFPPQRESFPDVVLTSNLAIVPQMRLLEFGKWQTTIDSTAKGIQFRYDRLNQLITERYGQFDMNLMKRTVTFLSPTETPGYWDNTDYAGNPEPHNPLTALIEGAMSVLDLQAAIITTKSGHWCDDWTTVTLPRYLASRRTAKCIVKN